MQKKYTFFLIIDYKILTITPSRVGAFIFKKQPISTLSQKNLHKNFESEKKRISISTNASQKRNTKNVLKNCFKIQLSKNETVLKNRSLKKQLLNRG